MTKQIKMQSIYIAQLMSPQQSPHLTAASPDHPELINMKNYLYPASSATSGKGFLHADWQIISGFNRALIYFGGAPVRPHE